MGWQKKSSGKRYDSKSGHGFLIGLATKKIIGAIVFCKSCARCTKAESKGKVAQPHTCPRNYFQSPKSMESDGAVYMVSDVFNQYKEKVVVNHFLGDDDSTTRSLLKIPTPGKKGKLPAAYPQDINFWADVNHRVKSMVKGLFALADLPLTISVCTKGDALRIKRNFGYYIQGCRKDPDCSLATFIANARAPVEHHFHNHQWCHSSWCPFKLMTDHELEDIKRKQVESIGSLNPQQQEQDETSSIDPQAQSLEDLHEIFLGQDHNENDVSIYEPSTSEESTVTDLEGQGFEDDIKDFLESYIDYKVDPNSATFGLSAEDVSILFLPLTC